MTESAADIARALRGKPNGRGFLCRCPVPSHGKGNGDRNPSLSIADGAERLLLRCFAGCAPLDILDALQRRGLLHDGRQPVLNNRLPIAKRVEPLIHEADPAALAIWHAAKPIAGTLAEVYLTQHRGLVPPFPPSLRSSYVTYPRGGVLLPAMVAAVQAPDRRIVSVQATFLRERDGGKAPVSDPRRTTGALGAGAVRLAAATDVLGLAEGIEDALAAIQFADCPCWASLGAGRMHRVIVPDTVRELHAFCDDDEPGLQAGERLIEAHRNRRVVIHLPPTGFKDWGAVAEASLSRSAA